MLPLAEVEVSPPLAGVTFALGVVALWVYLGVLALSGRVFGGFVLVELGYRHWLALAAHCSFITLPIGLLQIGTIAWTSNPDLALSLADLAAANSTGVAHAFLARVSLRNVAFLTLFSFGAAVFTGSSWSRSAAFLFGLWIGLWFMLSWFPTCGA